jgi:hypothetical protein
VREIIADSVHAAFAYRVKLPIRIEIDPNHADPGAWHVRTGRLARRTSCPGRIFFFCRPANLPLGQCKWDHTDGDKQKQEKGTSTKLRFNGEVNSSLHESSFAGGAPIEAESGKNFETFFSFLRNQGSQNARKAFDHLIPFAR